MEKIAYSDFGSCLRLSNGTVELVVTTEIGPRIIRYGFVGGENILGEVPDAGLTTELGEWKAYGGHRLWAAPENNPRSYVPDNQPVEVEVIDDLTVRLVQPVEKPTGLQKEITVTLEAEGTAVTVEHLITNRGLWPIELAPWALTVLNGEGGGTVLIPQEPYLSHDEELLPARTMVLWHYTDLSDSRWTLGRKYIRLFVDAEQSEPQKLGMANKRGWAAYARSGALFVKTFDYEDDAAYADEGCNCETYTAGSFVELETLGPMFYLVPGESADHAERWELFDGIDLAGADDHIETIIKPLLR